MASREAVMPASTRRVAISPDCAARPTCSGLVIDPKFATRPPASEAAIATAALACSASSLRSDAEAAAAASAPNIAVGCQPLAWC